MSEFNSGSRATEAQVFTADFDPKIAARFAERQSLEAASAGQIAEFFTRINKTVKFGLRLTQSFRIGADSFMTVIPYDESYQVIVCRFDLNPTNPQHEFYRLDLGPDFLSETVETGQFEYIELPALNPELAEYYDPDHGFWNPVEEWVTLPAQTTNSMLSDLENMQPLEDNPGWVAQEQLQSKYLQFAEALLGCYFVGQPDGSYIRNDKDASAQHGLEGIRLPDRVGDAKTLCVYYGWMEEGDE